MSKYSLIPGLESFMEDTEVNVEVAVGEPDEVAEEVTEQVDAAEDSGAVTEEVESTDEQTEMILAQFAQIEHRYNHVRKYGVDRTFMRLFNSNGEMERAFRISLPSCESFDATGDKYSPESKAVLAGLEASLSGVWEFIKNLCRKIVGFFQRIIDALRARFGNLNKQIGRLRDYIKDRKDDSEAVQDVDRKVCSVADAEKAINKINSSMTISGTDIDLKNGINENIKTVFDEYNKKYSNRDNIKGATSTPADSRSTEEIKKFNEKVKESKKKLAEIKKDALNELKEDTKLSDISFSGLKGNLDTIAGWAKQYDSIVSAGEKKKAEMKWAEKEAAQYSARRDTNAPGMSSAASSIGNFVNYQSLCFNTVSAVYMKAATMAVAGVAARARYSTKI